MQGLRGAKSHVTGQSEPEICSVRVSVDFARAAAGRQTVLDPRNPACRMPGQARPGWKWRVARCPNPRVLSFTKDLSMPSFRVSSTPFAAALLLAGGLLLTACPQGDVGAPCNHGSVEPPSSKLVTFPALSCSDLLCVYGE